MKEEARREDRREKQRYEQPQLQIKLLEAKAVIWAYTQNLIHKHTQIEWSVKASPFNHVMTNAAIKNPLLSFSTAYNRCVTEYRCVCVFQSVPQIDCY